MSSSQRQGRETHWRDSRRLLLPGRQAHGSKKSDGWAECRRIRFNLLSELSASIPDTSRSNLRGVNSARESAGCVGGGEDPVW